MTTAIGYKNKANDIIPFFVLGDEGIDALPQYFRFTGPLVKRETGEYPEGSFFGVEYEVKNTNRMIKNIKLLGKDEIMSVGFDYCVKVSSVGATTNASVKQTLDEIKGFRGLSNVVKIVYQSVVVNSQPVFIPLEFDYATACAICDILAKDGTVSSVCDVADRSLVLYQSPVITGKAAKVAPKAEAEAKVEVDHDFFYLEPDVAASANILYSLFSNPDYQGVNTLLLSGPSGYGKTAFCKVLADKLGMKLVNMDMSLVVETEEVMGHRSIEGGSTKFLLNEFAKEVQDGNVIVVLDELNRTYAAALNALFPFLDHRKGNRFQEHNIKVGKRVIFIGTRNVGLGYIGTHGSDDALLRRFQFAVTVGVLPKEEEITLLVKRTGVDKMVADKIAKVAKAVRESDLGINCPPATTLLVAEMATQGVQPRTTFQFNLVNKIEDMEQRRSLEDLLNREFGMTFEDSLTKSNFKKAF